MDEKPVEQQENVFPGFLKPSFGHTQIPNQLIDELMAKIEYITELKVVLYIFRHTWGWQKQEKLIPLTTDEFMSGRKHTDGTRMDSGTGLSDWGVKDGIKKAKKDGYIVVDVNEKDKARIKKFYGIKMQEPEGRNSPTDNEESAPDGSKSLPDGRNSPSQQSDSPIEGEEISQRSVKENSKRKDLKENEERKDDLPVKKFSFIELAMKKACKKLHYFGDVDQEVDSMCRIYAIADTNMRDFREKIDFITDEVLKLPPSNQPYINLFYDRLLKAYHIVLVTEES